MRCRVHKNNCAERASGARQVHYKAAKTIRRTIDPSCPGSLPSSFLANHVALAKTRHTNALLACAAVGGSQYPVRLCTDLRPFTWRRKWSGFYTGALNPGNTTPIFLQSARTTAPSVAYVCQTLGPLGIRGHPHRPLRHPISWQGRRSVKLQEVIRDDSRSEHYYTGAELATSTSGGSLTHS